MDEAVRLSMAKWPNVPACTGWLALNRRGQWLLGPERELVHHRGLIEFINRNYLADDQGRWYCQNGPQQVFAALDCTPWVFRHNGDNQFETHTGLKPDSFRAAWMDEEGNLGLVCEFGPGLIHDGDLAACLQNIRNPDASPAGDVAIEALLLSPQSKTPAPYGFALAGETIPLYRWDFHTLAPRFGFVQQP